MRFHDSEKWRDKSYETQLIEPDVVGKQKKFRRKGILMERTYSSSASCGSWGKKKLCQETPRKTSEVRGKERTRKTTGLVQNSVHSWRLCFGKSHCIHLSDTERPGQFPCSIIETKGSFAAAQSTKHQSRWVLIARIVKTSLNTWTKIWMRAINGWT